MNNIKPRPLLYNRINLSGLITVSTSIRHNSTGIDHEYSFLCIYSNMVIQILQRVTLEDNTPIQDLFIGKVHKKMIDSLKWWKRLFPTTLDISGLFINCYIPQHRKNGY